MRPPWEIDQLPRPVFDPLTIMAGASLALGAFGTISSAMGQAQQGAQAQAFANQNAMIMQGRALQAENEARARADIQARDTARKLAATKAAYGASGVDVNDGTPLDVLSDQATEGELQRQLILYGGATQSQAYLQQAGLTRMQGQAAADAGNTAAGTTLLTGTARAGMGAYNLFGGSGQINSGGTRGTGPGTGYTY